MDAMTTGQDLAPLSLPHSFPVDEYTMTVGAARAEVSVHVFRVPRRADGGHDFLYEHVRCRREDVFATGASVMLRVDGAERVYRMTPDLGPCQIDMSGDVPYADRDEIAAFVADRLADLRADTARKGIPRLALRIGAEPETLVDPRSISIHRDGLFRMGHGWLMRWDEVADVTAPCNPDAAADLRLYAVDGRCVVLRVDLL